MSELPRELYNLAHVVSTRLQCTSLQTGSGITRTSLLMREYTGSMLPDSMIRRLVWLNVDRYFVAHISAHKHWPRESVMTTC